jgi:trehalose 6-phosphate synthase/phosphatase
MRSLRHRVTEHDVHAWADGFVNQLRSAATAVLSPTFSDVESSVTAAIVGARRTSTLRLLLDYDGTLVPVARYPELAAPDDELLEMLDQLARLRGVELEIVSGRPRETLEKWFGHLPICLWGEHGFWHRARTRKDWRARRSVSADWMIRIKPILEQFTASTPGSRLEIKSAAMAWHFRGAQPDFGARQAHELRMLLGDALSNQPVEVLEGKKVIEVRFRGMSKSVVAEHGERGSAERITVAFGDDRTDEDLFGALPESSITIAVGERLIGARYRVADHCAVRRILRTLLSDHPDGFMSARDSRVKRAASQI